MELPAPLQAAPPVPAQPQARAESTLSPGSRLLSPARSDKLPLPSSNAAAPVLLGTVVQKEPLLAFWSKIVAKTQLQMNFNERFGGVEHLPDGSFQVKTAKGRYHARKVLLALGRRGTPPKLGVPGEELPKVVYRLVDPEQYAGMQVLVVGGGDSALEAAVDSAKQAGSTVSLSYRGDAFVRVKNKNRQLLAEQVQAGRVRTLMGSKVQHIQDIGVTLTLADGQTETPPNQQVIVCAGGELPTPLLKSIGVAFETKFGKA